MTKEQGDLVRNAMNHIDTVNNISRNMIYALQSRILGAQELLASDDTLLVLNGNDPEVTSLRDTLTGMIELMQASQEAIHGQIDGQETLAQILEKYNPGSFPFGF